MLAKPLAPLMLVKSEECPGSWKGPIMPPTLDEHQRTLEGLCARIQNAHVERGIVCGEGSPAAQMMIVGEAPGREEDLAGRPFVGPAGRLLNDLLADAGVRREDVWITNMVKFRPTIRDAGTVRNRPPTAAEIRAYLPVLGEELEILQPRLVLCLGNVSASVLLSKDFKMTRDHGHFFPGPYGSRGMATYHPAYLLRLQGEAREKVLRQVRADLRKLALAYAAI